MEAVINTNQTLENDHLRGDRGFGGSSGGNAAVWVQKNFDTGYRDAL